jgi:hypothetical protein
MRSEDGQIISGFCSGSAAGYNIRNALSFPEKFLDLELRPNSASSATRRRET